MIVNDATAAQNRAADPNFSTWLSANAGSGKTRVLTDRVARLLLAGCQPQKILCLTYTKAAAGEMQNRLFKRLGEWAMQEESVLRDELAKLGIEGTISDATLAESRRLFARAIETPGGLKIQTIHSFCAGLLRRFPLEAEVSPNFTELDDRAAILMRQDIVDRLAAGEDVGAVDALARLTSSDRMDQVLAEFSRNSDDFSRDVSRADLLIRLGAPPDLTAARLVAEVYLGGEQELFAALIPILLDSGTRDNELADSLQQALDAGPSLPALEHLEFRMLFKSGEKAFQAKIGTSPTQATAKGPARPYMPRLEALMKRVEVARPLRLALISAEKTFAAHRFARAFLPRYQAQKAAGGFLDFDDLISRAARLLSRRAVADWVLFRLDGGIDHVLVDEAQDTSPGQWQVIEALTAEFTAGEGARQQGRTIFVVGDAKQSIYSFQGANLDTFQSTGESLRARHVAAGRPMQHLELQHSFRSSDAILRVVDNTFVNRGAGLGGRPSHIPFFGELPGRVDLWPVIESVTSPKDDDWEEAVDQLQPTHHTLELADKIACEIRGMIDRGTQIPGRSGPRRLQEGDVLILLRRRSTLFHAIIRTCKAYGLAVAGADRLKLTDELAVKDILALLSFLATPEDDLSLAAALRSPLFGWSEGALFDLAHKRPARSYLWAALRDQADAHQWTMEILNDLRNQADFLRPYELIERLLTRHGGRARLIARLGREAEDGIDALLSSALTYERTGVPSLTGFLTWVVQGEEEVKRRLDSGQNAIRVMTIHGAKGLEAPLVILPDTHKPSSKDRGSLIRPDGEVPFWKPTADQSPPLLHAAGQQRAEKEREEQLRLLYVAMTRAENWLIVAAAGNVGKEPDDSWYNMVFAAMAHAGAAGGRHEHGIWPPDLGARDHASNGIVPDLPQWLNKPAALLPKPDIQLSPSALGGAKALASETGLPEAEAKRQGTILHLLLEHLPRHDQSQWRALAQSLVGPDWADTEPLFAQACAVLKAPALAHIFAPDALVEVALSAPLPELGGRLVQGTIDRLLIGPDRILAIDFKSNAVVPATPAEVPDGILRQMGAYGAMLAVLYPDRRIETAIVWTKTAQLMPLPLNIVRDALLATTLP